MKDARDVVHHRLSQVKSFLAQEQPPRLSESDTKANFIEPIIAALGWEGIGVVTREYYVRNSQEFIDYVMRGPEGLLLAIEAKPLRTDLSDKHAAQLIQYCAVEGIEWAALMNGRELQFFNTFLKPDLAAKRVLQLDLLAYNTDEEFDALFGQIWQLSRESMTKPKGVRTWLNQLRLDTALRAVLLDPGSTTNRYLRKVLTDRDVSANSQEVAQWFRTHLSPPITILPPTETKPDRSPKPQPGNGQGFLGEITAVDGASDHSTALCLALREAVDGRITSVHWRVTKYYVAAEVDGATFLAVIFRTNRIVVGLTVDPSRDSSRFTDEQRAFGWARMTRTVSVDATTDIDAELHILIDGARTDAGQGALKSAGSGAEGSRKPPGVSLRDLASSGLLEPGTRLILVGRGSLEITRAEITRNGDIAWNGHEYRSLSDRDFIQLVGWRSMNGWTQWYADLPHGREQLSSIRDRYRKLKEDEAELLPTTG